MLESITLQFTDSETLYLPTSGITVFVGPNNSGKSLVLREVEQAMSVHPFPSNLMILRDYEVRWQSRASIDSYVEKSRIKDAANLPADHVTIGRVNPNGGVEQINLHLPSLYSIADSKSDKFWFATQFLRYGVIRLDGRSRFNLTNDQHAGDLLLSAQNILGQLFRDDNARSQARNFVYEAFGVNLVIDPTNLGNLRIRLSSETILDNEQAIDDAARRFHSAAVHIKDASDGVQAYVGIVSAVVSGEFHTTLIDEPEAFLHPPLARKLGRQLSSLATSRKGSLMASTHSADFLLGCVQGSADVRVVRLEFQNGRSKGRLVDPISLRALFQNPLMRSTNATSALFYDGVVVTESDNDRAFYSEIYQRQVEANPSLPSLLFINAQNKQTIKDIVGPLRRFGVPAAAIVDIDIVKDGGTTWSGWMDAAHIPVDLQDGFKSQRHAILQRFSEAKSAGKDMKRDGGISVLQGGQQDAASHFFDAINAYGIFPVRGGELESWLPNLNIPGQKTDWTISMLQALGSDPTNSAYVRPSEGDVWSFMMSVVNWIKDAKRRGTP